MNEKEVLALIESIDLSVKAIKAFADWHWDNDPHYVGSELDIKTNAALTSLENSFAMIRKASS